MSRVSIVIPTYNRAEYIEDTVGSALRQGGDVDEVVVVDDGSTDATEEIAKRFPSLVTYARIEHSGLPARARNHGLALARGDLVVFLDSDDLLLPDAIAPRRAALEANAEAALAYSDGWFFRDDPGQRLGCVLDGLPAPSGDAFPDLLAGNFLFPATALVRRACVEAAGGFDEDPRLLGVEDYDLWLRLAARFPFVHVPGHAAAIRRHAGSLSRDVAALRARAVGVLHKMDRLHPEKMRLHRRPRHEAYARHNGAVALACLQQRRLAPAAFHAAFALAHALALPRLGLPAFVAWRKRRYTRQGARP